MYRTSLLTTSLAVATLSVSAMAETVNAEQQNSKGTDALKPVIRQNSQGFSEYIKDKLSIHVESNHFDWKGKDDNSKGKQTFTPVTVTYRENNIDLGIRRAHINSKNETPKREGEVTTLSDSNLSLAYTQPLSKKTSVRFSGEWNLPTGKATLDSDEKNAMMDGGLVDQVRFGEGLNITTGASLVHNVSDKLLLGLGYSHTWLGTYDPNLHVSGDKLNPGNQDHITLQGQYKGDRYLLLGGATYTMSDVTEFGHKKYYEKGNRLDTNVTGIYALTDKDRVTLGARYSTQKPDTYVNRITGNFEKESRNVNGDSVYVYGEYARNWRPKHTIKFNASYFDIDANSYDFSSDYYNAGRNKVTYGMGYDWQIMPKLMANASIKRYEVTDKASFTTGKDTEYQGWNSQVGFSYNF
ncbi:MAG: hypothetical protein KGV46_03880 [Pasteurella sp.]|nr:hypothetical protein [Pasteurella sp.]